MSFSASLRRCAPSAGRILRQESTIPNASASSSKRQASKSMKRQQQTLPPEKLRALISLYHQSDTFITHENLVEKINEALIGNPVENERRHAPGMGIDKMFEALAERRKYSKVGPPMDPPPAIVSEGSRGEWSSRRNARERRVLEALYGVDMSKADEVKPGLELLRDAVEKLDREAAEDAKSRS